MVAMRPRSTRWCRLAARLARVAVLGLAVLPGCDRINALLENEAPAEGGAGDDGDATPPAKEAKRPPKPKVDTDAAPSIATLERSRRRADLPARGVQHLGYNLDTIDGVRAQSGAPEIPTWGVPGDGPIRTLRDDDLETGWTCPHDPYRPCAVGFHLTTRASMRAVRLYAAAPGKAYEQHRRIAEVRVHTDEGWFDAKIDDGAQYVYVVFGKPVETATVVLEVLAYHGRKTGPLFVAELEVYGRDGTPREPLAIDPERIVTEVDGKPWTKSRDGQIHGPAFLEVLQDDGSLRRLLPGTAIYGRADDEILLVESLAATDCQTHTGMFYLLNRTTRVEVPVGDLGSMGGQIFRSKDGRGFVGGFVDELDARVTGVVLEGDSYKNRRTQRLGKVTGPKFLDTWGIDRVPLPRGGAPINGAVENCKLGADDTIGALRRATGGTPEPKPGEWMVCALEGGAQAFLTDHGPCGKSWEITVLDARQKIIASKTAKRKGARLRVRRRGQTELLVELGGIDDATELVRVGKAGIVPLGPRAFAAAPPEPCRKRCDDTLVNNTIP